MAGFYSGRSPRFGTCHPVVNCEIPDISASTCKIFQSRVSCPASVHWSMDVTNVFRAWVKTVKLRHNKELQKSSRSTAADDVKLNSEHALRRDCPLSGHAKQIVR